MKEIKKHLRTKNTPSGVFYFGNLAKVYFRGKNNNSNQTSFTIIASDLFLHLKK